MEFFPVKKLNLCWVLGADVFNEWDEEKYINNFGIGKRHPGLLLFGSDGKEILVVVASTPHASIDASDLMDAFKIMDDNRNT